MHDFSVWLKTGSNPADSNQFRSHMGKYFQYIKGRRRLRGR